MKFIKLAVSKKEIFKIAHEVARDTVKKGDNYAVTFGAVLKEIYAAINLKGEYVAKSIKSRLNAFFSNATGPAAFNGSAVLVKLEDATTVNVLTENEAKNVFEKMSLSVIDSIWDYMPYFN